MLARSCRISFLTLALGTSPFSVLEGQDAPPPPPPPQESDGRKKDDEEDDNIPTADVLLVTALRHLKDAFDTPGLVSSLGPAELETGPGARSLPNSLVYEPSVMVQKTGSGQSSPFIRGFTGFRTLMLIDGIRLNNSVFRDGPNQYWSTVDQFSIETLELTRGPSSVLWGSDAIGGAVNALTGKAEALDRWHGRYFTRWASAERSWFNRLEVEGGQEGEYALRVGVTDKHFGDLRAGHGSGDLPGTAYDEKDMDVRLDLPLDSGAELTFAAQHVKQYDVPRTHTTVDAVPFHGTAPGTELKRDLDQERNLIYSRLGWDGGSLYDSARFTLSWQQQEELQKRLRPGTPQNLYDETGFDVHTWGTQLEFERDTSLGLLTWGFENFYDDVDSASSAISATGVASEGIQGPVGDDADYGLFGAYIQDEVAHGPYETVFGVRWSHASAEADKVDNPNVPGSNPATPGNIISVEDDWSSFVGSVRSTRHMDEDTNYWAGLSQGFRAPNLSDLTSELTDSGITQPTPDLDPEYYTTFEVGTKEDHSDWLLEACLYYTWIRDMIIASPTGEFAGGVPFLTKSNVGDGKLYGAEFRAQKQLDPDWTGFAVASWQDGLVAQFTADGDEISDPTSRVMPFTMVLGATWQPVGNAWWLTADTFIADKADKLSVKDTTDTQRIPPGGTPGYGILGVRYGKPLDERSTVTVGLENILNHDYRIHGSGVNEPGRSLVLTFEHRF